MGVKTEVPNVILVCVPAINNCPEMNRFLKDYSILF